ncbi:glycosyltransferase family 87 protein [Mycobacterium sp.]|uniref:glycosyltransferase family 87 protein n=1 Tax=Mycobacterium sp. TaxID=1785 RepID=UPI003F9D4816
MKRPVELMRGAITPIREQFRTVGRQSERTLVLGAVLLASVVSAVTGFVLAQYYSVDVLASLTGVAEDCWLDWGVQIGRHCFSDYAITVDEGMRPNPWGPYPTFLPWDNYQAGWVNYPAAALVPQLLFAVPAKLLGAPQLGLIAFLLALTIAVLAPAFWASRGARGLERVVVFVVLGAAAMPAWAVIDRGNSVGFLAPIALFFLLALRRERWGLVTIAVVLAALLKPQFAILAVALFASRQWRLGGIAVGGAVISNLAAYLLWPRDFPLNVVQSIKGVLGYGGSPYAVTSPYNVSFASGLFHITNRVVPLFGYSVLIVSVVCILGLGRRIPPVMVGIALLATATLFPFQAFKYYLVFALPIAALVVRDPDGPAGSGIFDRLANLGDRRRAVGICVSLAAALSITWIALPSKPTQALIAGQKGVIGIVGTTPLVPTTVAATSLLWLVTCASIIVSYARRPAPRALKGACTDLAPGELKPAAASRLDRP